MWTFENPRDKLIKKPLNLIKKCGEEILDIKLDRITSQFTTERKDEKSSNQVIDLNTLSQRSRLGKTFFIWKRQIEKSFSLRSIIGQELAGPAELLDGPNRLFNYAKEAGLSGDVYLIGKLGVILYVKCMFLSFGPGNSKSSNQRSFTKVSEEVDIRSIKVPPIC